MLHRYLDSGPSVTERLAIGAPPPEINTKRAEVQARLDEWQASFGSGAILDEWQRLLDEAKTYVIVDMLLTRLDADLRE